MEEKCSFPQYRGATLACDSSCCALKKATSLGLVAMFFLMYPKIPLAFSATREGTPLSHGQLAVTKLACNKNIPESSILFPAQSENIAPTSNYGKKPHSIPVKNSTGR